MVLCDKILIVCDTIVPTMQYDMIYDIIHFYMIQYDSIWYEKYTVCYNTVQMWCDTIYDTWLYATIWNNPTWLEAVYD